MCHANGAGSGHDCDSNDAASLRCNLSDRSVNNVTDQQSLRLYQTKVSVGPFVQHANALCVRIAKHDELIGFG